jgi:hypothetical protein
MTALQCFTDKRLIPKGSFALALFSPEMGKALVFRRRGAVARRHAQTYPQLVWINRDSFHDP